jgi:hypothetical protein
MGLECEALEKYRKFNSIKIARLKQLRINKDPKGKKSKAN